MLELDFIKLLETDNTVAAYYAQPERIEYLEDEKRRVYFPDFRVIYRTGPQNIVEVKPSEKTKTPENILKFQAIGEYYANKNIRFEIKTELEIRRQPRLSNADVLLTACRRKAPEALIFRWQQIFDAVEPSCLADLAPDPSSLAYQELLQLTRLGHFDLELDRSPLTPDTSITSGFRPHPGALV